MLQGYVCYKLLLEKYCKPMEIIAQKSAGIVLGFQILAHAVIPEVAVNFMNLNGTTYVVIWISAKFNADFFDNRYEQIS